MIRFLLPILLLLAVTTAARADTDCLIVSELRSGTTLHTEGEACDERIGPASTFKFVLAVIGFDAGVLVDADNPAWPYLDRYDAVRAAERQTVTPATWMRDSVIWYSRKLVAELGAERFADYVVRFSYGNADVSGDAGADNGLTHSWLNTSLLVSPADQVRFVRRVLLGDLPVSAAALQSAVDVTPAFEAGPWVLQGKTGTGYIREANGKIGRRQYGWFIGWAVREGEPVVFAALRLRSGPGGNALGPRVRDELIARWPELMADVQP